ncbi:hypothetical protein IEQ34_026921 [Dendrobium chrysotoxum]|uniref:Translin-associated protein X n=1 Tax=Dendrobium chrysotoxum TaxID=161865 RepID=A0AAV7FID4_DENCH|nr:hypothetical protein IEQ34_026921 [Dendrobium chrysotoxum]
MAAKPHRLHQLASVLSSAKKPRMMSTNSSMKEEFAKHADYLNQLNDKRERVVKASRDVTMNSKKVIFQVHRANKDNREEVLSKAEKDLAAVTDQFMSRLVKELKGNDFWKLRRAYTFAVQEYVEAATFCRFCRNGSLLDLKEINDTILQLSDQYDEPLQINALDYLLGLADLTGELMRLAIGRISDGEVEYAEKICRFVQDIYRELTVLAPIMDDNADMKKKMETMLQSLALVFMFEDPSTFLCLVPMTLITLSWDYQTWTLKHWQVATALAHNEDKKKSMIKDIFEVLRILNGVDCRLLLLENNLVIVVVKNKFLS